MCYVKIRTQKILRLFTEMDQQLGTDVAITKRLWARVYVYRYIFALNKDFFLIHVGRFSP